MGSRRELIRMTTSEIGTFLNDPHVLNIATHDSNGDIHLVPMWYGFLGESMTYAPNVTYETGTIVIETFAKSQKVLNLQRNSRFAALVERGEQYDELAGIQMRGNVDIVRERPIVVESCKAVLSRYHSFATQADLDVAAEMAANKRVCLVLRVDELTSWDHSKLNVDY